MKFVQTIAWKTSRMDQMQGVADRFRAEKPDPGPGFIGLTVLKDRDRENAYMVMAEFDSYELAMENSGRPETDAFARKMAELVDGPPTYGNYDVIDE